MSDPPPPPWRPYLAAAANVFLAGAGVFMATHPRSRVDLWRGAAAVTLAVVNVLAVTLARHEGAALHTRHRLWRIALVTNAVLLVAALALVVSALATAPEETWTYSALILPAAATLLALRRPA